MGTRYLGTTVAVATSAGLPSQTANRTPRALPLEAFCIMDYNIRAVLAMFLWLYCATTSA